MWRLLAPLVSTVLFGQCSLRRYRFKVLLLVLSRVGLSYERLNDIISIAPHFISDVKSHVHQNNYSALKGKMYSRLLKEVPTEGQWLSTSSFSLCALRHTHRQPARPPTKNSKIPARRADQLPFSGSIALKKDPQSSHEAANRQQEWESFKLQAHEAHQYSILCHNRSSKTGRSLSIMLPYWGHDRRLHDKTNARCLV
jgi:hypothetical protein